MAKIVETNVKKCMAMDRKVEVENKHDSGQGCRLMPMEGELPLFRGSIYIIYLKFYTNRRCDELYA